MRCTYQWKSNAWGEDHDWKRNKRIGVKYPWNDHCRSFTMMSFFCFSRSTTAPQHNCGVKLRQLKSSTERRGKGFWYNSALGFFVVVVVVIPGSQIQTLFWYKRLHFCACCSGWAGAVLVFLVISVWTGCSLLFGVQAAQCAEHLHPPELSCCAGPGQAQSHSRQAVLWGSSPTGKVCIQRRRLDVSFMGMRDGAKGLMRARCGAYPPGRMCSRDSALPTWNRPGALESRCWDSSMFSRKSAKKHNRASVRSCRRQARES